LRRWIGWIAGFVLLAVIAGGAYLYWQKTRLDPAVLEGRWQRPDGGYVLELSGTGPTGQVKAAYFNPQPIHVSQAKWQEREGRLGLFIELRDVNYPGCTYTLEYQTGTDQLVGVYYQASMRQQFDIEFVRMK
jgi:hypothetical protein